MCGILIVHSKRNKLKLDRCKNALERLSLRGPDYEFSSIYRDESLFFGQTVLSITGDPKNHLESYHHSVNKSYDIVLNGEIYNHYDLYKKYLEGKSIPSLTGCDTETLVNLHQILPYEKIFKLLRGMFAYAIYDKNSESIIIGRDIIGEKILYCYEDKDLFVIASEIGAILEICPSIQINKELLKEYFFTRHFLTTNETTFQGIKLIQPGNLIKYDLRLKNRETLYRISPSDLINPNLLENNKSKTSSELIDELEEVFIKTAKLLSPKIEYYSVFSGGIDSSLASYFMNKYNPPEGLISLQFPGKDNTNLDMTKFEEKMGRKINTLEVNENLFSKYFTKCYKAACGPLSTHSFVSQAIMSDYLKNDNIKVLIGGDGADELFGGYEFYKSLNIDLEDFPETNPSAYSGFVEQAVKFKNWETNNLELKIKSKWQKYSKHYSFENDTYERMLQTVLYSDTVIQLESVGIRAADTMSMVNSVESRSFFLNYDIIKFALNLPTRHKVDVNNPNSLMSTKPLLKKLFARIFGKKLIFNKQGFSGYPNEAAKSILSNQYPLLYKKLKLELLSDIPNRTLQWKMMNTEIFLRYFYKYL